MTLEHRVVLPCIEQAVVLVGAGHAVGRIRVAAKDLLANRVGEAFGHEPHRIRADPACPAVPIQGQAAIGKQLPQGLVESLHERHRCRSHEATAWPLQQIRTGRGLIGPSHDIEQRAGCCAIPAEERHQLRHHAWLTTEKGHRAGRHDALHQDHRQASVGVVVTLRPWRKPDQILGSAHRAEIAGDRQPAPRRSPRAVNELDAQIGHRFAHVVQQRGKDRGVGPEIPLRVDLLGRATTRQEGAVAQPQCRTDHLDGVCRQAAHMGMMVRLAGRQKLDEFEVARDRRRDVARPGRLRELRFALDLLQGRRELAHRHQGGRIEHPEPA